MAYALRYYKEIAQADGSACRLEIYKKDSTASAIEIGAVVQGLSLEIQGQQGDVDSPIVKTSLSMTFVDAGDLENGQKNGFWEEFYTPDALLWKVILKVKDSQETAFRTMWGGYVTPDSFSENLVYRGSVSIIARDNIGHMQDFPFDAEGDADGLISLRNLVSMAWEKIQSPMDLEWNPNQMMVCDGVPAYDTLMNVSQFEGMDWYKAVEIALASYGMVMRFVGDNAVHIGALRFLPNLGWVSADSVPHMEPRFISGATRELVPAVRRIEESVKYDLVKDYQPKITTRDFSGNTFDVETSWGVVEDIAWSLIESAPMFSFGWYNEVPFKTLAFNPNGYEADDNFTDSDREALYGNTCILTGTKDDDTYSLSYVMTVGPESFAINIQFGQFYTRWTNSAGYHTIGFPLNVPESYAVRYAIKVEHDGGVSYLTQGGEWTGSFVTRTAEVTSENMSVDVPLSGQFAGKVMVSLVFLNIDTGDNAVRIKQILGISLSDISTKPMLETNSVNTVYNADNNVILSRSPEIGPAYNGVALPAFIRNGIFLRDGDEILPAKKWGWSGGTMQQMAVFNHLQLLSYFAKPNNLISGTIVNADITRVGVLYQWHGAEHMLMSGRYNFLNGFIENAVLREFARYEDMWSEVAGAALPETEEEGTTNVESGTSSGGSSPTYTNTTTVNIGTGGSGGGASYLDDLLDVNVGSVTAQSILYYNGTEWVAQTKSAFLNGVTNRVSVLEGFWYDEDGVLTTDKAVRIKNNLIVTGDTASGGEGEDTPAIGTVTGVSVNGVRYTDVTAGILDLSDAFNGITVDLSGYYTKQEVDNKIAGLNISQYATITALNAVSDRVLTLENAGYATTGYVDTKIANLINGAPTTLDTLKEIADALAENEDVVDALEAAIGTKANASDLTALAARVTTNEGSIASLSSGKADKATTLAGYGITNAYTKTEVDSKVTTINNSITAVSGRVTTIETWKTELSKYITIVDGNVKISTNLIVSGDTASGGDGEDTAAIGTVTGIKVNGTTYNPTAGIVTIPDYPTTLEWDAIGGKPSFATVATSGNYDDLSNKPTIPSLTGYATQSWVEGKKYITASAIPTLYVLTIKKADGTTLVAFDPEEEDKTITLGKADVGLGNVENTALSTWAGSAKITTLGTITSGTWNGSKIANSYLANSAMTIAGNSVSLGGSLTVATLQSSLGLGSLAYKSSLVASDIPSLDWSKITSGKPTTLSGYGITDAYTASTIDSKLASYQPLSTAINTGNIGSQSVQSAKDALRFKDLASSGDLNTVLAGGGMARTYSNYLTGEFTNAPSGAYFGTVLQLSTAGFVGLDTLSGQLAWDINHNSTTDATRYLWWRAADTNGFTNSKWHQIAFTDSNVASATKLATARTIWGQSFDGTGNVSGNLLLNNATYIRTYLADKETTASLFGMNASNDLLIGYGTKTLGETGIYGKEIYFAPNGESVKMRINSSGNVTIGNQDLAGTSAKLYVNGNTTINGVLDVNNSVEINNGSLTIVKGQIIRFHNTTDNTFIEALGFRGDSFHIGYGNRSLYDTYVQGNNIVFRPGAGTEAMRLNSSGAMTVASTILASSVICGTTRLRVNATGSTTVFGFIDANVFQNTTNVASVHIGSCYGGSSDITNTTEYSSGVSMTAISIYRGKVGIGKRWSDTELRALHDAGIYLGVAGGAKVDGALTVGAGATITGNSTINGNLVVTGDVASA